MPRKYIPKTPDEKAAGRARQLRAHNHNSFLGYVAMGERQMLTIMHSDTATEEAKDIAASILGHMPSLKEKLKTRVD